MADIAKAMLKVKPKSPKAGEVAKVSLMAMHAMETGMSKDKTTGELIPANFIHEIEFFYGGQSVTKMVGWETISANPFYEIGLKVEKSDELKVVFKDNLGNSQTIATNVTVG